MAGKQRAAPQAAAVDDRDDQLLKPTLGNNAHVMNLAQFAALAKELDQRPKKGTAAPATTTGPAAPRSPGSPRKAPPAPKPPAPPPAPTAAATRSQPPRTISPPVAPASPKAAAATPGGSPPAPTSPKTPPPHHPALGSHLSRPTSNSGPAPVRANPNPRDLSPMPRATRHRAAMALTAPPAARSLSAPPVRPLSASLTAGSPKPVRKTDLTALLTAVRPLPHFQAQVRRLCKLDHMDIAWLAGLTRGGPTPATQLSLDNMPDNVLLNRPDTSSVPVLLNSPRSVLACLRTGINPIEVQQKPLAAFASEGVGAAVSEDILRRRMEFFEAQRQGKLKTLRGEYRVICDTVEAADLLAFFRKYDAMHPTTAYEMALPFEGQEGVADYSLNIEKEIQAQKERSQKMIEARKREIEKRLRYAQELQQAVRKAVEERQAREEKMRQQQEEERRAREQKSEQQKQRQLEWKQHLEEIDKEQAAQAATRQALLAEKEQLRAQLQAETQEKRRQELEAKAIRNAERLVANKEKMTALLEERRQKFEEKSAAAEEKRLQMEAARAKEREAFQLKAQQVAAHQQQISQEAQRRLEGRQAEEQRRQQEAQQRLQEFWTVQEKKREEKRVEEQKKEEARKHVFQAAKDEEERKRQLAIQKQTKQEEVYRQKLQEEQFNTLLESEDLALQRAAKADFVQRQQRIQAFEQLRTIDQLQRKADRVVNMETRKVRLLEERREERLQMEVEKERMLTQLQTQCAALSIST